jgi:hypothetical protein
MKDSLSKLGMISRWLFVLGFILMGVTAGAPYLAGAEEERPQGTVRGKVMATEMGVKGAEIYQYVEGEGWKHVATSGGYLIVMRGHFEFTTDAGTHDFKAEWAGRVQIKKNVKVKENPAITELNFYLPLKDE